MVKTITWKPKAAQQYRELLGYLKNEFSETTAQNFITEVNTKLSQVSKYPESGHATSYKTIRRVKIGKYNSFYTSRRQVFSMNAHNVYETFKSFVNVFHGLAMLKTWRREVYYRISSAKIIVIFIWDSRIDPNKNPYK